MEYNSYMQSQTSKSERSKLRTAWFMRWLRTGMFINMKIIIFFRTTVIYDHKLLLTTETKLQIKTI